MTLFDDTTQERRAKKKRKKCVHKKKIKKHEDKSIKECKRLCMGNRRCVAFEYGMEYNVNNLWNSPRACILKRSDEIDDCDGEERNVDLYVLNEACRPLGKGR